MSRGRIFVLGCCLVAMPFLMGAKPAKSSRLFKNAESVELFAAIKAGEVEVKFIPKDAEQANVILTNKTKKPLRIAMPAAFAGVPVLAQDDGGFGDDFGGGGGGFGGDQGGQQGQQALGGGMGGGMMGGGMGGMGGGMFNVGPERVQKIKVGVVCLEHGKKDPNPRVPYEIRPIKTFTSDVRVHELCTMLGRDVKSKFDHVAIQAAAWHLTDDMSAQQLAQKVKVKHLNGTREMFFSAKHLQRAAQIVHIAKTRAAKKASKEKSPGESQSDSQSSEESL